MCKIFDARMRSFVVQRVTILVPNGVRSVRYIYSLYVVAALEPVACHMTPSAVHAVHVTASPRQSHVPLLPSDIPLKVTQHGNSTI